MNSQYTGGGRVKEIHLEHTLLTDPEIVLEAVNDIPISTADARDFSLGLGGVCSTRD